MGNETSEVGGHPLAFLERLHRMGGQPDIEFLAQEPKRHAVVVFVDLDMIIDVDGGHFPLGVLVKFFGQ